jgi:hypothetical protein
MLSGRLMRYALATLVALLALAAPASPATTGPRPLLPDLLQATPTTLTVSHVGSEWHLNFASVVFNYGKGPLIIQGSRPDTSNPQMVANQVVAMSDGSQTTVPNIGRLEFVHSETHNHWHYLKFDTYSLVPAAGGAPRQDRKTGFCLGDREPAPTGATGPPPGTPADPFFTGGCGYDHPELLTMTEGISVGYGDDYLPRLEGQYVDMTGLPAGRYTLVHHVNADRALRESDMSNNAGSVLVELAWKKGVPTVTQLAGCNLSARCPDTTEMTPRQASTLAREAFRRAYRKSASPIRCAAPVKGRAQCYGQWRGGNGVVKLALVARRGFLFASYTATAPGQRAKRGALPVRFEHRAPVRVDNTPLPRKGGVYYCPLLSARG